MSKQTVAILGVLALTFGSGMGVGFFLGNDPAREVTTTKVSGTNSTGFFADATAQDREENNAVFSTRIRELETQLADKKVNQKDLIAARLAFFMEYHDRISIEPFGAGVQLSPEMVELLGLSKEEQAVVQQHLDQAKTEMDNLEDANTAVTKQTPDGISITIAADPKGKAIKDELSGLLSSDMGDQRAGYFMTAAASGFAAQLADFGDEKRDIDITWKMQNGSRLYNVKNTLSGPGNNSMSSFATGALPSEYQKYLPSESGQ